MAVIQSPKKRNLLKNSLKKLKKIEQKLENKQN